MPRSLMTIVTWCSASGNSAGPRGPAVWMLKLSVTGVPDAWARGGFLDSSFIRLLRLRLGRLATHYSLRGIEVAARRPPCCGVPVSQRRLPWPHLLTDVRSREPGAWQAHSHWLGNHFGSIAAIVPILPQSSAMRSLLNFASDPPLMSFC